MDTHILGRQTLETDPDTSEERPALALPQDLKTLCCSESSFFCSCIGIAVFACVTYFMLGRNLLPALSS
jgi:hypothetical protein